MIDGNKPGGARLCRFKLEGGGKNASITDYRNRNDKNVKNLPQHEDT